jgi:hypothetical protein
MRFQHAIAQVLRTRAGRRTHLKEIQRVVNKECLYERRDGTPVPTAQISARVSKYPKMLKRVGAGIVELR